MSTCESSLVDLATEHLSNILTSATEIVIPIKLINSKRRKNKCNKKWFDKDCFQLISEMNRLTSRLSKNPFNPYIRKAFIQCRKQYRKLLKLKEKEYFRKLKAGLKNLEHNNPKQFWSIIKSLQKDNNIVYKNPVDNKTWQDYFNKLYQENSEDTDAFTDTSTNSSTCYNHEDVAIDVIINNKITGSEVKKAIRKLKNGKSAGEDNILDDVLKTGELCLVDPLVKLMNLIFESEKYPLKWTRNLLITLHKGGLPDKPDNYRGISISSCLSKLFSTVLYFRILEVNENFSLLSNNQIGFLKGFRTADHVLLIDTVINEVVHRHRKRLFVAFVDLEKAYDKVNRNFMIDKLKVKGFTGKFLKIIEAMLNNIVQIPKINSYFLSPVVTTLGLKQGDNLSPILFDIFFDDVEEIFDEECDPVILSDELSINHLLYADDMAILSMSSVGLQNSLNKLYTYCNKWGLKVSTIKTKVVVFNTSGRLLKGYRFYYNGISLEQVKEFKYLGTTFSASGSHQLPKEKLRKQANKAYFPMLKALHKIDFDAVPSLHLFDTLIAPILNYNCEVLNQISKHRLEAINNNAYSLEKLYFDTPGEKVHLQLCRNILGVSNKTSVVATFGELGCYPLMIGSFSQIIKYWHRIKTEVDNSFLIYKVVSFMENRESLGQHNWLSTIKFILHYCGMDDVWFNPHTINNGSIAPKCSVILRNKFVDYWSSLLHDQHSSAYNGKKTRIRSVTN